MQEKVKIARRYAKGLFDFALDTQELELVYDEMRQMLNLIDQNPNLRSFLTSPLLNAKEKQVILDRFSAFFSKTTASFLKLISLHKRTFLLKTIAMLFLKMYLIEKGFVKLRLTTAIPLNDALEAQIRAKVSERETENKKYVLSKKVDPSLIAGFILRIGNKQWDLSLSGKISRLRKSLWVG